MKYQVIARKFRPQAFEDVVGQTPIVQTLRNAIEMDRAGHAYLFSGPRGVGKTTMARLLAKALNCADGPTPSPCNACPSCLEVAAGHSIDVLEIDAASNTGVDSIRELRENARYAPSRDRFKIFIVDEVHMLSTSAFNALLKTLEEPPAHIVFIMATTERHKLPATILSRCQQFVFRIIPPAEIHAHLRAIAEKEGIAIGEKALDYVVRAAGGSMRDAQSLLDQIIAFGGQEVSDQEVRDVLGFMPAELLTDAVDALAARDPVRLLRVIEIVVEQGLHLQQFLGELLGQMRNLLVAKLGLPEKVSGGTEDRERTQSQAARFSEQELIRFFDALLQLESDLKWTGEPRFHLEMACVRLTQMGRLRDLEDVIRELKSTQSSPKNPETELPSRAPDIPADTPTAPARSRKPVAETKRARPPKEMHKPPPPAKAHAAAAAAQPDHPAPKPEAGNPPSPTEPAAHAEPESPSDGNALREAAKSEPVVQSFLDIFRGEISHVRSTKTTSETETD